MYAIRSYYELIQVAIRVVTGTSIIADNSLTDTNSVTLIMFLSDSSFSNSSWRLRELSSRLSRLCFEVFDFCLGVVSLANVSFICFCTSSSATSVFLTFNGFFRITSYNVCYTKLLRYPPDNRRSVLVEKPNRQE